MPEKEPQFFISEEAPKSEKEKVETSEKEVSELREKLRAGESKENILKGVESFTDFLVDKYP